MPRSDRQLHPHAEIIQAAEGDEGLEVQEGTVKEADVEYESGGITDSEEDDGGSSEKSDQTKAKAAMELNRASVDSSQATVSLKIRSITISMHSITKQEMAGIADRTYQLAPALICLSVKSMLSIRCVVHLSFLLLPLNPCV